MTQMIKGANGLIHLLRPGVLSVEDDVYFKLQATYDGIMLNAPTIAYKPEAATDFLTYIGSPKPYLVDPRTYALARDRKQLQRDESEDLRLSWENLLQVYNVPSTSLPITVEFFDEINAHRFAEGVVKFQEECIPSPRQSTLFSSVEEYRPMAVIAPYFFLESEHDPWLEVNIKLIRSTLAVSRGVPVFAVIYLHRGILKNEEMLVHIMHRYAEQPVNGFLLWVDDFREWSAEPQEIWGLRKIISMLKAGSERMVISMYGGYLSVLLSRFGLDGFSHSIQSGENRKLDPIKGGPQEVHFYFPPLHRRYSVELLEEYLNRIEVRTPAAFYQKVCDCTICKGIVQDNIDGFIEGYGAITIGEGKVGPEGRAKGLAILHFLIARHQEIVSINGQSMESIIDGLVETADAYRDPVRLASAMISTDHLKQWAAGLRLPDQVG